MKLGQTLLTCPSSANLIEANVVNSILNGVDLIECICDNPDEVMHEKLYKLRAHYGRIICYECYYGPPIGSSKYLQNYFVNKMIDRLISKECDWIINSDDDEFYDAPFPLRNYLDIINKHDINWVFTDGYCYYETVLDYKEYLSVPLNLCYRDPEGTDYAYRKAIFRSGPFISTTSGNHKIIYAEQPKTLKVPDMLIRHYTHRSKLFFKDRTPLEYSLDENQIEEKSLVYDDSFKEKLLKIGFSI